MIFLVFKYFQLAISFVDTDDQWFIAADKRIKVTDLIDHNRGRPSLRTRKENVAKLKVDILQSMTEITSEVTVTTKCAITLELEGICLLNFQHNIKHYSVNKIHSSIRDKERHILLSSDEVSCCRRIVHKSGCVAFMIDLVDVKKLETIIKESNISETVIVEIKVGLQSLTVNQAYNLS